MEGEGRRGREDGKGKRRTINGPNGLSHAPPPRESRKRLVSRFKCPGIHLGWAADPAVVAIAAPSRVSLLSHRRGIRWRISPRIPRIHGFQRGKYRFEVIVGGKKKERRRNRKLKLLIINNSLLFLLFFCAACDYFFLFFEYNRPSEKSENNGEFSTRGW